MKAIEIAKEVFKIEAESISDLTSHLDENFNQAVEFIFHSQGRCIVSGMG
ncbi:arabinose-5-phosphate isomerase, partial [Campylobacter sp. BCW_8712]